MLRLYSLDNILLLIFYRRCGVCANASQKGWWRWGGASNMTLRSLSTTSTDWSRKRAFVSTAQTRRWSDTVTWATRTCTWTSWRRSTTPKSTPSWSRSFTSGHRNAEVAWVLSMGWDSWREITSGFRRRPKRLTSCKGWSSFLIQRESWTHTKFYHT